MSLPASRIFEILQDRESHETVILLLDEKKDDDALAGQFSWRRYGDCKPLLESLLPSAAECQEILTSILTPRWKVEEDADIGAEPDFKLKHGFRESMNRPDFHDTGPCMSHEFQSNVQIFACSKKQSA